MAREPLGVDAAAGVEGPDGIIAPEVEAGFEGAAWLGAVAWLKSRGSDSSAKKPFLSRSSPSSPLMSMSVKS